MPHTSDRFYARAKNANRIFERRLHAAVRLGVDGTELPLETAEICKNGYVLFDGEVRDERVADSTDSVLRRCVDAINK